MPHIRKETQFESVARLLKGYASAPQLADKLGCSANKVRSRLDHPEDLTLGELRTLSMRMHIPKEEILSAIKW